MAVRIFPTRMGWVGIASSDSGITDVILPKKRKGDVIVCLRRNQCDFTGSSAVLQRLESELTRHFKGEKVSFSKYSLAPRNPTDFRTKVWAACAKIPYGHTFTYGDIAAAVGRPRAARAVGSALNANPLPIIVPCHRVVSTDGIGGFSSGTDLKEKMLHLEGRT
jgi:methylated-DNA-[protein]-cysteine S-methyltransferase